MNIFNSRTLFFGSAEVDRCDQGGCLVAICDYLYSIPRFDCCRFFGEPSH